ncbi:MAG: acylphosphatase [Methylocystis sp.]|nr:acylphosphatase [Methylocystis sp.]
MTTRETIRLVIDGRVQGVGYRAFLQREAALLGLAGWTRNRSDGSVEAVVTGPRATLDALVAAAKRGPSMARVENVREAPAADAELKETARFVILPTR